MALLAFAVVNAAFVYFAVNRHADQWDTAPPSRIKIMAVFSLAAWAGVVFAGRAIAYF